ncbi:hypothetical protein EJ08DRAFT_8760 [Tothia fuscella]|uniref:Mediator of RNA polymerase II transcription subunit 8 n=1 Tax=Tothia fuscella TaxID=1048955 RepID=A0A9P4P2C2_9PEZI|nr:hypothetical protein EJ08DRAFT_8760 [Tothia fuscella]
MNRPAPHRDDGKPKTEPQVLDLLRQRTETLSKSLETFLNNSFLAPQDPNGPGLPSWSEFNATFSTQTKNLTRLQSDLATHHAFLLSAHIHPNATFPADKDFVNESLLRKRLAPEVETWVSKRLKTGKALTQTEDVEEIGMGAEDWKSLWDFAGPEQERIVKEVFPDIMGREDDDEDYGEEEDGEDEVVGMEGRWVPPAVKLRDLVQFASIGVIIPEPKIPEARGGPVGGGMPGGRAR